jgi:hypothetical protein
LGRGEPILATAYDAAAQILSTSESHTMRENDSPLIVSRAGILAEEFLTRRKDVAVRPFADGELDLVCTIDPAKGSRARGFMPFGVIVWGTDAAPPAEHAAAEYVNRCWHARREQKASTHFFIPVLALAFWVSEDVGYYSWISEPHIASADPKLLANEALGATKIRKNSLDGIVEHLREWYALLEPHLILDG